jgi:hypothetical protein
MCSKNNVTCEDVLALEAVSLYTRLTFYSGAAGT